MEKELDRYSNKTVMVTGGLGFIGSNLVRRLDSLDTKRIIVVDSMLKGHGANNFNLDGVSSKVEIPNGDLNGVDLRDQPMIKGLLRGVDYIFNLAGSVSHVDSKKNPVRDLEINLLSHVAFLDSVRQSIEHGELRRPKILFSATRDVYGKVPQDALPVKEDALVKDVADPQGIHNYATEFHHLWYASNFGFDTVSLRLVNTYGPRQQMKSSEHGFTNWFVRQALDDKVIELWGGGQSLRDFNYVDDVVDAMLLAMANPKTNSQVYNLGSALKRSGRYVELGGNVRTVSEAAESIIKVVGSGSLKIIPYPQDKQSIEPGHFYADITKFNDHTGWEPKISFEEGVKRTAEFYRANKQHYW
jgi:UDP-glucose 4-epimerase